MKLNQQQLVGHFSTIRRSEKNGEMIPNTVPDDVQDFYAKNSAEFTGRGALPRMAKAFRENV